VQARATFESTSFEQDTPREHPGAMGHQATRFQKTFQGDIEGHGSIEMLGARSDRGGGYVAIEHITGTVQGVEGGFSLLHIGTMEGDEVWTKLPIVPSSGSGGLASIRGEGKIDVDDAGVHTLTLDYELGGMLT